MIIDTHHHWMPKKQFQDLDKLMRKGEHVTRDKWGVAHLWRNGIHVTAPGPLWCDLERQVDDMDAAGIDMAILSLAGTHEWTTSRTAPYINDCTSEAVQKYPGRFEGLCHVSLEGRASLKELERAIKELGFLGVNITTHIGYRGTPADTERFWPFWEAVADLDTPVVVQPYGYPAESKPLAGLPILSTLVRLDNVLRFMMRIVYGPLLDKFPTLRILCPHIGGGFFAVMSRMAPGLRAFLSGEIPFDQLDERQ
ncbi:amidohydrolase family protein, partial [Chloroflexota bacterium]